jgi:hypothetical protein
MGDPTLLAMVWQNFDRQRHQVPGTGPVACCYPGTGIGLALCKRIVEHHGGTTSLDTAYPAGTRICFTLPRADSAEPADDEKRERARAATGGRSSNGSGLIPISPICLW